MRSGSTRTYTGVEAIGVDETSRRGHNYITVVAVERNVIKRDAGQGFEHHQGVLVGFHGASKISSYHRPLQPLRDSRECFSNDILQAHVPVSSCKASAETNQITL